MTKKLAFDGRYFWLLLLFVGAPAFKWWIDPELTFIEAFVPYAIALTFMAWFGISYVTIVKFEKTALGWLMVIAGISAVVFTLGWPR